MTFSFASTLCLCDLIYLNFQLFILLFRNLCPKRNSSQASTPKPQDATRSAGRKPVCVGFETHSYQAILGCLSKTKFSWAPAFSSACLAAPMRSCPSTLRLTPVQDPQWLKDLPRTCWAQGCCFVLKSVHFLKPSISK